MLCKVDRFILTDVPSFRLTVRTNQGTATEVLNYIIKFVYDYVNVVLLLKILPSQSRISFYDL